MTARRVLLVEDDRRLGGHVPDGGRARVAVGRHFDLVVLTVTDNGDGLDPAAGAELLGRFARGSVDGDGRRFGLGLALVHEVVLAHRGRLLLGGARGVGAEITVELPAVTAS